MYLYIPGLKTTAQTIVYGTPLHSGLKQQTEQYSKLPHSQFAIIFLQGMHELLAPLIFVLHCDHQAFLHASEMDNKL